MRAGGGEADQDVTRLDRAAINDFAFFHYAHGKTGEVVIFTGVHARQFGGFAADQRATGEFAAARDAFDHGFRGVYLQLAAGVVIQEKQRLGPRDHDVVDAHGHEVDADGVVAPALDGELEFGADAVGAGDQHRVLVAGGAFHQRADAADAAQHFRPAGAYRGRCDALHQRVARVNIHTGVAVSKRLF